MTNTTNQDGPELLRVRDVAQILNLSRERVHRLVAKGTIPKPFYLAPRCPRWRRSAIERWLAERERAA